MPRSLGTILKFADDSKGGIPLELRIMIWVLAFPWLNKLNKQFLNTEDALRIQKIEKAPDDYHPRPSSLRFCKVQGIVEKYARVAGLRKGERVFDPRFVKRSDERILNVIGAAQIVLAEFLSHVTSRM